MCLNAICYYFLCNFLYKKLEAIHYDVRMLKRKKKQKTFDWSIYENERKVD